VLCPYTTLESVRDYHYAAQISADLTHGGLTCAEAAVAQCCCPYTTLASVRSHHYAAQINKFPGAQWPHASPALRLPAPSAAALLKVSVVGAAPPAVRMLALSSSPSFTSGTGEGGAGGPSSTTRILVSCKSSR
jgi:hypothetical protein